MIFLANENFPFPSVTLLRKAGFTVLCVSDLHPGISDQEVIDKAKADNLVILTFDKDYGEIIYRHSSENPPTVIFFRFKGENPESAGQLLVDIRVNRKLEVNNKFTVVEKEAIRQRTY